MSVQEESGSAQQAEVGNEPLLSMYGALGSIPGTRLKGNKRTKSTDGDGVQWKRVSKAFMEPALGWVPVRGAGRRVGGAGVGRGQKFAAILLCSYTTDKEVGTREVK